MPLSLYTAFVPSARQMLGTAHHLVDKAEAWCDDNGHDHDEIIRARIHADMLPFAYQVKSVAVHTAGAIEAVGAGLFSPHVQEPPYDFAQLRTRLDDAIATLDGVSGDDLEARIGAPMRFEMKQATMDFTVEDFLLSFSQPNFYFHAATAYDILRMKGVEVGKRDFMGRLRIQRS